MKKARRRPRPKPRLKFTLEFVRSRGDIGKSILTFNFDRLEKESRIQNLLQQTQYWVFDPMTQLFGPSKFVGFREMSFPLYEAAIRGKCKGNSFNGTKTRVAIESVLGDSYKSDAKLSMDLEDWGTRLSNDKVFAGVNKQKWRFVTLYQALPKKGH